MDKFNLLDCTLRDGGYINNWEFDNETIKAMIAKLVEANIDFVECGYINSKENLNNSSIFNNIEQIREFIPKQRKNSVLLVMADVMQFKPEDITAYTGNSVDGIRVVFYKHQVDEALKLCLSVKQNGYKLVVQPMVTIEYTVNEYMALIKSIAAIKPYAISIVDSFGCMSKQDFMKYFRILDNVLDNETLIGFHCHNNMQSAFTTGQEVLNYITTRRIIIDASLYGMGRGAGNLNLELIANYYNMVQGKKYDIDILMELISDYIMPIAQHKKWGYSPHFYLTGLHHCHPNFASYLLENHDLSVSEFSEYIKLIPAEMRTKCRRPFVEELYQKYLEKFGGEACAK
jgi:4-hydroxy 2-oxovalerate aldolase